MLIPSLFVVAIFYGDLHIAITFPLSMLLLPLLFAIRCRGDRFPIGIALLAAMLVVPVVQAIIGPGAPDRSDVALYLPIIYGVAVALIASRVAMTDVILGRSLLLGGGLTGATMIATILLLPPGRFPIPGQDFWFPGRAVAPTFETTAQPSTDIQVRRAAASPQVEPGMPDPVSGPNANVSRPAVAPQPYVNMDHSAKAFYDVKNLARSPLGRSNYLSAFFVLVFTVSLFQRHWSAAALFGALAALTLSRLGLVFSALAVALFVGRRFGLPPSRGLVAVAITGAITAGLLTTPVVDVSGLPMGQSLNERLHLWRDAVGPVLAHPFIGAPRSAIMETFKYSLFWNPHNVTLWTISIFGVIGAVLYFAYLWAALRIIYLCSLSSDLWTGLFVGLSLLLAWSMVEIIAFTPAFEILLATCYGLASQRQRNPS